MAVLAGVPDPDYQGETGGYPAVEIRNAVWITKKSLRASLNIPYPVVKVNKSITIQSTQDY